MRLDHEIDDEEEDAGSDPWALGDLDLEPMDVGEEDGIGEADGWLDEQLGRVRTAAAHHDGRSGSVEAVDSDAVASRPWEGDGGAVALRRSAPSRPPRRRRAEPAAAADLPAVATPGYVRDRRGTWRYSATGGAVPGARDLTLRSFHRFPDRRGQVLVPLDLVRSEAELAWCMTWRHTLTTRVDDRQLATVLRVPADEWERRADIPFGIWAPELTAARLVGVADVARIAGVSAATITAYLARRRMPPPVSRIGNSPVWSRPVIHHWLANRPGQGVRPRP